ncbi:MAG: tetratricopeptide repeat protein [Desulfovibrio sp.]
MKNFIVSCAFLLFAILTCAPVAARDIILDLFNEMDAGQWHEAERSAVSLIKSGSAYPPEVHYVLGISALHKNSYEQATKHLQKYLKSNPQTTFSSKARRYLDLLNKKQNNDALQLFLASEWDLEDKKPLKAIKNLRLLISRYPDAPLVADAQTALAWILTTFYKDYAGAQELYNTLLQKHPDDQFTDNALYGLGRTYELSNNVKQATSYFRKLRDRHALFTSIGQISVPALNQLSRLWHSRAIIGLKRLNQQTVQHPLHANNYFLTGVGDRLVFRSPSQKNKFIRLWDQLRDDEIASHLIQFTVNRKTPVTWENRQEIKTAASLGYTPVIIFQYFDEDLSPEFVRNNEQQYYQFIDKVITPLLKDIPEPYILLEAEFNRGGVENWEGWNDVARKAIKRLKTNLPTVKVGLTVGDWNFIGREQLKKSMGQVAPFCDFIGYQFMISNVEEDYKQDPAGHVTDRILDFADYLQNTFNKPLLLGYFGVSTYNGWEEVQKECLEALFRHQNDLMNLGVFGVIYFTYFDDPLKGGWFGPAEGNFGLIHSNGNPKPALDVFRKNTNSSYSQRLLSFNIDVDTANPGNIPITAKLSVPAHWMLKIQGDQSGAQKCFSGFSAVIAIPWNGASDSGVFRQENCIAELTIMNAGTDIQSGKTSFPYPVFLKRDKETLKFTAPYTESPYTFVWNRRQGGTAYRLNFAAPMVLRSDDTIHFQLRAIEHSLRGLRLRIHALNMTIPFDLEQFSYKQDAKGQISGAIHGSQIISALQWRSRTTRKSVSIDALDFLSLEGNAKITLNDLYLTTRFRQNGVLPSPSSPPIKKSPISEPETGDSQLFNRYAPIGTSAP